MKYISHLILYLYCLWGFQSAKAQYSETQIKSTMIYHICENIEWSKPINNEFKIGYFSEQQDIYNFLKINSNKKKIHGKPYVIQKISHQDNISEYHAIYINNSNFETVNHFLKNAKNNNVLIITDQFPNLLFCYVNLIHHTNKINFKINLPNLTLAGLKPKTNLLLNGGSNIDIKQAYENFEEEINLSNEKLKQTQLIMKSLENQVKYKDAVINEKNSEIIAHQCKLELLNLQSDSLKIQVENKQKDLIEKENQVAIQTENLKKIHDEINFNRQEQSKLMNKIIQLRQESEKLHNTTKQLKGELDTKNNVLISKETFISSQKRKLVLTIGILVACLIAAIALTFLFILNKKHTKQLGFVIAELESNKLELNNTLESLKETQAQLVHSEKMASLGVMAAGVAHEINNPLNYIKTAIYALKEELSETNHLNKDEVSEMLNSMSIGVDKASGIVKNLNKLSRKSTNNFVNVDLHQILDTALLLLTHEIKNKCKVEKLYYGQELYVKAVEDNIHQVFINLITNAIHAITNNGIIYIETYKENNFAVVVITDNGCGIAPENLKKILDPFFTTKEAGKGTGLGLSITYNIIKEHKGSINFESKLNEFTKVFVKLPLS